MNGYASEEARQFVEILRAYIYLIKTVSGEEIMSFQGNRNESLLIMLTF